jgi:DNA-binding transcriptional LysR family regulator
MSIGYAQSNISAQIQQLEQELNTKLLDRIGKKVFLTESGEQLLPYAIEMRALASTIRDKLDNDHLSHSRIVVGASESLCVFKLPAIVESFRRSHPNNELHLELIENAQVVEQLTSNAIDVAFTIGNSIEHPAITSFLKKREEVLVLSVDEHELQLSRDV